MEVVQTKRKRKTPREYRDEHELFIILMQEQKPPLEIRAELGLTQVQFKRHLLDALTLDGITAYQPPYEVVTASALPAIIGSQLGVTPEALVKIQKHDSGVLLSRLSAAPEREHEKNRSDNHPNTQ